MSRADVLEDANLSLSNETIAHCRIGERPAPTWFVLHELLGLPDVKNYNASWTDYGFLMGVPITVGDK